MVMLLLPMILVWVPIPGLVGLVAGLIGGYLIGRPGRAFLYALLPFVILSGLLAAAGFGLGLLAGPAGAVAGGALTTTLGAFAFLALLADHIALLLGAAVGGAWRQSRRAEAIPAGRATGRGLGVTL
jgi:hypothetical protein